jgi:hypothetical protein
MSRAGPASENKSAHARTERPHPVRLRLLRSQPRSTVVGGDAGDWSRREQGEHDEAGVD